MQKRDKQPPASRRLTVASDTWFLLWFVDWQCLTSQSWVTVQ